MPDESALRQQNQRVSVRDSVRNPACVDHCLRQASFRWAPNNTKPGWQRSRRASSVACGDEEPPVKESRLAMMMIRSILGAGERKRWLSRT
ncbi:hypothetical protein M3J09_013595 [Ascochyta lentis]